MSEWVWKHRIEFEIVNIYTLISLEVIEFKGVLLII
jgi:hypothetical protein